jgi:predicted nucleic acid-binding protein
MILVDTGILVAWLDPKHPDHRACSRALEGCAAADELAISAVTVAELASSGRRCAELAEDLRGFQQIVLESKTALQAGHTWAQLSAKAKLSLADVLILEQASALQVPLLRMEHRGIHRLRHVDILLPIRGAERG